LDKIGQNGNFSGQQSDEIRNMAESNKKEKAVAEVTTLDKKLGDGEEYFAVAHIFASFNDTFVHITDLSGNYVI